MLRSRRKDWTQGDLIQVVRTHSALTHPLMVLVYMHCGRVTGGMEDRGLRRLACDAHGRRAGSHHDVRPHALHADSVPR